MSRLNHFLAGVKVLDLSRHFPGPLATLTFADMGAEVIKVEAPGGEEMRSIGPRGVTGRSVYFDAVNAGKRGLRLDLKAPNDLERLLELVTWADVLIHSFRPGVMDRLGLSDARLAALNPRLVRCGLTGYGETGPRRLAAGHDANYLAEAGILHRNGATAPAFYDPPIADVAGALFGAIAILGALHERTRTGQGCHIDLGLADAVMPLQAFQIAELWSLARLPQPHGELLNGGAAFYQVYPTCDGRHVVLGAVEAKFWAAFCNAAARPDWISRQSDPLPQMALKAEVSAFFKARSLNDIQVQFAAADCCLSPVLDLAEAVHGDHHQGRGLLAEMNGSLQALFPALVDGGAPAPRPPFREGFDPHPIVDEAEPASGGWRG